MPEANDPMAGRMRKLGGALIALGRLWFLRQYPDEWMDVMTQRFLLETERQLRAAEKTKAKADDIDRQAKSVRTLAQLGRTFTQFATLHGERLTRAQKDMMSDAEILAQLERKLFAGDAAGAGASDPEGDHA